VQPRGEFDDTGCSTAQVDGGFDVRSGVDVMRIGRDIDVDGYFM
jgi:hypothetical protein